MKAPKKLPTKPTTKKQVDEDDFDLPLDDLDNFDNFDDDDDDY